MINSESMAQEFLWWAGYDPENTGLQSSLEHTESQCAIILLLLFNVIII